LFHPTYNIFRTIIVNKSLLIITALENPNGSSVFDGSYWFFYKSPLCGREVIMYQGRLDPKVKEVVDRIATQKEYDEFIGSAMERLEERQEERDTKKQELEGSNVRKVIFYERIIHEDEEDKDKLRLVLEDRAEIHIPINRSSFFVVASSGSFLFESPHKCNPEGITAILDKAYAFGVQLRGTKEAFREFKNEIFPAINW